MDISRIAHSAFYLAVFAAASAQAVTFTYSGVDGANSWSSGTDWDATPVSASDTTIDFTGVLADGAVIDSSNDIGPFTLNRINLLNEGPGSGVRPLVTVGGGDLNFVADGGTNPQLRAFPSGTLDPYYTINNNLSLGSDLTLFVNSTVLTLNGQISGTGAVSYTGSTGSQFTSVVELTNTSNDWSGGLQISSGGTVGFSRTILLGASEVIPHGAGKGDVTMRSNGEGDNANILRLNGFDETINGISASYGDNMRNKDGKRVVENFSDTSATLTLGANDTTASFIGQVRDGTGAGNLSLVKIGAGTQTLAARSSHSGSTTVNGGTLEVDFTQIAITKTGSPADYFSSTSAVNLGGDATFAIKGRPDGSSYFEAGVATAQYGNYVNLADTAGLVVGQELIVTRADTSQDIFFITAIIGNRVWTNARTGSGSGDVTIVATPGSTTTQNLQSITFTAGVGENATIDLGTSDNVQVLFGSAPVQLSDGSTVTFANWTGTAGVGGGPDQIIFAGEPGEFSSIFDQSEIIFDGYGIGYDLIDGSGVYEVVAAAVPEPETYALVLACGALLLAIRRRRR